MLRTPSASRRECLRIARTILTALLIASALGWMICAHIETAATWAAHPEAPQ